MCLPFAKPISFAAAERSAALHSTTGTDIINHLMLALAHDHHRTVGATFSLVATFQAKTRTHVQIPHTESFIAAAVSVS